MPQKHLPVRACGFESRSGHPTPPIRRRNSVSRAFDRVDRRGQGKNECVWRWCSRIASTPATGWPSNWPTSPARTSWCWASPRRRAGGRRGGAGARCGARRARGRQDRRAGARGTGTRSRRRRRPGRLQPRGDGGRGDDRRRRRCPRPPACGRARPPGRAVPGRGGGHPGRGPDGRPRRRRHGHRGDHAGGGGCRPGAEAEGAGGGRAGGLAGGLRHASGRPPIEWCASRRRPISGPSGPGTTTSPKSRTRRCARSWPTSDPMAPAAAPAEPLAPQGRRHPAHERVVQHRSSATGRPRDQLGRSAVVPGRLGRRRSAKASSSVAPTSAHGAAANRWCTATITSSTGAPTSSPLNATSLSRSRPSAASSGSTPAARWSAASSPDHTPAIVGRSWVVTAPRAWAG